MKKFLIFFCIIFGFVSTVNADDCPVSSLDCTAMTGAIEGFADGVDPTEMADDDFGDFTCSSGSCTLDGTVVDSAELTTKVKAILLTGAVKIEYLSASDDNFIIPAKHTTAITITKVWCKCQGTCTTPAQISFEDESGNAMSHGTLTCAEVGETPDEGGANGGLETVDSGGGLSAYESMAFDVDNTPTTGDTYIIGWTYTVD